MISNPKAFFEQPRLAKRVRVLFLTVVPSPYQRDLLSALSVRDDIDLTVRYLEAESPGYPWPQGPLGSYEEVLPGNWVNIGGVRVHWNRQLPDVSCCDVVVLNSYTSVTAQLLMRRCLRNTTWFFWGERLSARPAGVRAAIRRFLLKPLRHASGLVGIGSLAQTQYQQNYPAVPTYNVPYYCDLRGFLTERRSTLDIEPRFLFCGQMIERKGVDLLLRSFQRLIESGCRARLSLVGQEANLPRFLDGISEEVRDRICYYDFRAPSELPRLFAQADVFVMPSRHDGWGVVVNQAIGAGLALICSDAVGAAYDLVVPEKNGVRYPANDSEALFRCMKRLVESPTSISEWGRASRIMARDWTPDCGAARWANIFRRLLPDRTCSA